MVDCVAGPSFLPSTPVFVILLAEYFNETVSSHPDVLLVINFDIPFLLLVLLAS